MNIKNKTLKKENKNKTIEFRKMINKIGIKMMISI